MIEDARARQRRHRRIGGILLLAAIAAGSLIVGFAGGGGGGGGGAGGGASGQPAGSGGGSAVHLNAGGAFPGAPSTQRNGYGVETDDCPLAPASRYLPARSGCVTVRRVDVDGDGKSDLILVYSRLSRQHPAAFAGMPARLRGEYMAEGAFLKVVLADGTSVSTRIGGGTAEMTKAAAIDAVGSVSGEPGAQIFLQVQRISSGATDVVYSLQHGRLVPGRVLLYDGGDSVVRSGFDCLPGTPPRLIQRSFMFIGPILSDWWQETDVTYAWHGATLEQVGRRTFKRHGSVPASEISVGHGCTAGVQ